MHSLRTTLIGLACLGLALIMGNTGCQGAGSGSAQAGSSGAGGVVVVYGPMPTHGSWRPLGVAVKGAYQGQSAWVKYGIPLGALMGSAAGKAAAAALGGESNVLPINGDPCLNQPDDKIVAKWPHKLNRPAVFLDCKAWRMAIQATRHGKSQSLKAKFARVLRCTNNILTFGSVTPRPGGGGLWKWTTPANTEATVLTDGNGRIISVWAHKWINCGGSA